MIVITEVWTNSKYDGRITRSSSEDKGKVAGDAGYLDKDELNLGPAQCFTDLTVFLFSTICTNDFHVHSNIENCIYAGCNTAYSSI